MPEMTIEEAFKKFLQSKYWSNIYESAPERVKQYLRAKFAMSLIVDDNEEYKQAVADLKSAKAKLTKADCEWLLQNCGASPMSRWHYKTMVDNAKP